VLRQLATAGFRVVERPLAVLFFAAVVFVVVVFFFFDVAGVVVVVAANKSAPAHKTDKISIQTLFFNR
jgi:hypothetical protein